MNERRRLAVLSEHMESRLVLSPMAMVPIRGIEPITDLNDGEATNDNSSSSEFSITRTDASSQTSQRMPTVKDNTAVSKSPAGIVEPASQSAEGRGPRNPVAGSDVSTTAKEVTSTPLTTNDRNNGANKPLADRTTSSASVSKSQLSTASPPTVEAQPSSDDEPVKGTDNIANDDVRLSTISSEQPTKDNTSRTENPVHVPRQQEISNDVVIKDPNSDDIIVGVGDISTGTKSTAVTVTPSRQVKEPASRAETSTSTLAFDTRPVDIPTETPRDRSSAEVAVKENGNKEQAKTVRPASQVERTDVVADSVETQVREPAAGTLVGPNARQRRATIQETERTPLPGVDTNTAAADVSEPAVRVSSTPVDDGTSTSFERVTDAVERADVDIISSDFQSSDVDDTASAANKTTETVDAATTSDFEAQRDSVESSQAITPEAIVSSWMTAEELARQKLGDYRAEQWLSEHVAASVTNQVARTHATPVPGSGATLPRQSRLFLLAEATAQSPSDSEHDDTTHTFFGDATRVGLMLAAINHAGRRSGSLISVTESWEELRGEGSPYSRERRRRRSSTARRMPTSFDRLRQAINPLESVDENNSLPSALPSPDAVFADAASMSLLYKNDFGGRPAPRSGFLWGSLLLGGAGLAVNRAGRSRKPQKARQLIPPSAPRNTGETLKFPG